MVLKEYLFRLPLWVVPRKNKYALSYGPFGVYYHAYLLHVPWTPSSHVFRILQKQWHLFIAFCAAILFIHPDELRWLNFKRYVLVHPQFFSLEFNTLRGPFDYAITVGQGYLPLLLCCWKRFALSSRCPRGSILAKPNLLWPGTNHRP